MYNSNNIADRIKELAKAKNIALKDLLKSAGLGINAMANMKTSMPKSDSLAKIADCLGVSLDYLMGRVPDESDIDKELANVDFALYNETKELNDSQKKDVLKFVQFLKNKDEE